MNVDGTKLKMVAEKRLSDGKIQVVVIPQDPSVQFEYSDMEDCFMGASWNYGKPMVKVHGKIEHIQGNATYVTFHTASIFYNTVPDFTEISNGSKDSLVFRS